MPLTTAARWLVRLAIGALLVGVIAGVFEILASQMPYTPLHVEILVMPVRQLRTTAVTAGLLLLGAAWLWPVVEEFRGQTIWLGTLTFGLLAMLGTMAYGAAHGMMGLQVFDPHEAGRSLAYLRLAGQAVFTLAMLEFGRRVLGTLGRGGGPQR